MANDLNYYMKYINFQHSQNDDIQGLSDKLSEQRDNAISPFTIKINSNQAESILLNSISYKSIIKDKKDSLAKIIQMNQGIMKQGDYVEYYNTSSKKNDTYLINTKVEAKGLDYDESNIENCNSQLKFQVNSTIYSIPAIIANQTLYTVGIDEGKYFTTGDTKMSCVIGVNDINKDIVKYIFRGMRFIFDSNGQKLIYKITYIDTTTNEGILTCTLQEEGDLGVEDDLVNMVAYNPELIDEVIVPSVGEYQIVSSINNYDYINLSSTRTFKVVNGDNSTFIDTFIFKLEQSDLNPTITPQQLIILIDNVTLTTVKLTANSYNVKGYVNLVATCNRDGSIYKKSVRIKGLTDL